MKQEQKVTLETQALQDLKETLEIQVQPVKLVRKGIPEIRGLLVKQELKVIPEILEQQAILVLKETLGMMVKVLMYTKTMLTDR